VIPLRTTRLPRFGARRSKRRRNDIGRSLVGFFGRPGECVFSASQWLFAVTLLAAMAVPSSDSRPQSAAMDVGSPVSCMIFSDYSLERKLAHIATEMTKRHS